jgi:hypothetical protein
MKERIRERVPPRDQFEHPHFRGAKPRRTMRQFFEQIDQNGLEQRQGAQIRAEQIETGLRRRRSICLPGRAGCLKFLFGDVDGRRLPLAKPLSPDHREVDQAKLQPGESLRMRPEIID